MRQAPPMLLLAALCLSCFSLVACIPMVEISGAMPRLAGGVGGLPMGVGGRQGGLRLGGGQYEIEMLRSNFGEASSCTDVGLRGGGGLAKKMGGKNVGLLIILLSLLYLPRAMSQCAAQLTTPRGPAGKVSIQKLGCGPGLMITNLVTLSGLAMVLVNSRNFDRHGRSKLKMRLTGASIMAVGMLLIIAHAGQSDPCMHMRCAPLSHDRPHITFKSAIAI